MRINTAAGQKRINMTLEQAIKREQEIAGWLSELKRRKKEDNDGIQ